MERGGSYSNTLTPDSGYKFVRSGPSLGGVNFGGQGGSNDSPSEGDGSSDASIALTCTVAMGGENVTSASFDIATGEISIDEVTGRIEVTVEPDSHPQV